MANKTKRSTEALNSFMRNIRMAEEIKGISVDQNAEDGVRLPEIVESNLSEVTEKDVSKIRVDTPDKEPDFSDEKKKSVEIREIPEKKTAKKETGSNTSRRKGSQPRQGYAHYGVLLSEPNITYVKKIKRLEGEHIIDVINSIFDEHRSQNEESLDAALSEIEQKSKSWRK